MREARQSDVFTAIAHSGGSVGSFSRQCGHKFSFHGRAFQKTNRFTQELTQKSKFPFTVALSRKRIVFFVTLTQYTGCTRSNLGYFDRTYL
jgi:hypothetical protein